MTSAHPYDSTNRIVEHLLTSHPSPLRFSECPSNKSFLHDSNVHSESADIFLRENGPEQEFNFEIEVNLGDGRIEIIFIDEKIDPKRVARQFCRKYKLQDYVINVLASAIQQKSNSEKELAIKERLSKESDQMRQIYSQMHVHEVLISEQDQIPLPKYDPLPETTINTEKEGKNYAEISQSRQKLERQAKGADKILMNSRKFKSKHNSGLQINAQKENISHSNASVINPISQQICQRIGKQNILSEKQRKSREKMSCILRQRQKQTSLEIQECSFHPKINIISKKVDQELKQSIVEKNIERYEQLYDNHKEIQKKKQVMRKHSISSISFQPEINKLSKSIMERKRSIVHEESGQKRNRNAHQKSFQKISHPNKIDSSYTENKSLPNTNRKIQNRNPQNLSIGHYLYNQAMKKQSKKKADYHELNPCRILSRSQHLVSMLKEKRVNQIFTDLTTYPHEYLTHNNINLSSQAFKSGVYRLFLPIFSQMIELGVELTREQFMEASLKLLKYLSPEEKSEIMLKKDQSRCQGYPTQLKQSLVNSKSRELLKGKGYNNKNIYDRGLIHCKQIKEKAQKGREDKVRQELQNCTFKPSINRMVQFA